MRVKGECGQATVELALCVPFVVILCAVVVQVGLLAADQVRVWHAAREAARIATVDGDPEAIRDAAARSGLDSIDVVVVPDEMDRTQGGPVTVRVAHRPNASIPLIGALFDRIVLRGAASMRVEQP